MKLLISTLLLASTTAFAAPAISTIPLQGGAILPTQKLSIGLDKLVPGIAYNVSCAIHDANNAKNPVVMRADTQFPSQSDYYLNGKEVGHQMQLTQVDNSLLVTQVYSSAQSLNLINADQDDTLTIADCVATAATKSK